MINSILNVNHRRIVLDRVLIDNNDHTTTLLTEPTDINTAATRHFQTAAGAVNQPKIIPPEWIEEYNPISHIDDNVYLPLIKDISIDELITIIHELPHNKACGPSTISNEMIKHYPTSMILVVKSLFSKCLLTNDILEEWKLATIYLQG